MRVIETQAVVTADGQLILRVPADIPPGEYRVVVVVDEQPAPSPLPSASDFPVIHAGSWPEGFSLRREDLYDDGGR